MLRALAGRLIVTGFEELALGAAECDRGGACGRVKSQDPAADHRALILLKPPPRSG
jgi:hypothetical protein